MFLELPFENIFEIINEVSICENIKKILQEKHENHALSIHLKIEVIFRDGYKEHSEVVFFIKKNPALRVGRARTRLTVHRAFPVCDFDSKNVEINFSRYL